MELDNTAAEFHPSLVPVGDVVESAPQPAGLSFLDELIVQHLPKRFVVLEAIGEGAYGKVYRARDDRLHREVAIKVLRPEWMNNPATKSRFLRESRAAARLNHSAVVRVLEADENSAIAWQVCDLINGPSLATYLQQHGALPTAAATKIVSTLADAVDCAHRAGIVHRDIKPENILLQCPGEPDLSQCNVLLTDFGLAKILDDDLDQSRSGTILGTPRYMAPEQFESSIERTQPSADQYALGMILFECLTGVSPFHESHTLAQRIAAGLTAHPTPRQYRKSLSVDLETICMKAMHPSPSKRYATAGDLAKDLNLYSQALPIMARSQSVLEKSARFVKRHTALVSLTSTVVVCLAVIAAIALNTSARIEDQNRQLESVNKALSAARDEAELFASDSDRLRVEALAEKQRYQDQAWNSGIRDAYRAWEDLQYLAAEQLLNRLAETHDNARQQLEWKLLDSQLHYEFQRLLKIDHSIEEVRWIPGTQQVAMVTGNGHVLVADGWTGQECFNIDSNLRSLNALAVQPARHKLLVGGATHETSDRSAVFEVDYLTAEMSVLTDGFETTIESIEVSRDGKHAVCGSRYECARLYDLDTLEFDLLQSGRRHNWMAWIDGVDRFAFEKSDRKITIVDGSRLPKKETYTSKHTNRCGAAIPGTCLLALLAWDSSDNHVIDVRTRRIVATLEGLGETKARCMSASPDGRILVAGCETGEVIVWHTADLGGRVLEGNAIDSQPGAVESEVVRLQPLGRWGIATGPLNSVSCSQDQVYCASQSGELFRLSMDKYLDSKELPQYSWVTDVHRKAGFRVAIDKSDFQIGACWQGGHAYWPTKASLDALWNGPPPGDNSPSSVRSDTVRDVPFYRLINPQCQMWESIPVKETTAAKGENEVRFAWMINSQTLQVCSEGKAVRFHLDIPSGSDVKILGISPDRSIVAVGYSRTLLLVDVTNEGQILHKIDSLSAAAYQMDWHPDGNTLLLAGNMYGIIEYDLNKGEFRQISAIASSAECVCYGRNGDEVFSGHDDGTIRITNRKTGSVKTIQAHRSHLVALTVSKSGEIGISVDADNAVAVWRVDTGEKVGMLSPIMSNRRNGIHPVTLYRPTIQLSADDSQMALLYTGYFQPRARFWNLK